MRKYASFAQVAPETSKSNFDIQLDRLVRNTPQGAVMGNADIARACGVHRTYVERIANQALAKMQAGLIASGLSIDEAQELSALFAEDTSDLENQVVVEFPRASAPVTPTTDCEGRVFLRTQSAEVIPFHLEPEVA